ncbi:hypothetical protein [Thermomonospora umbrina]|uniref:Small secreted protein n=1 Tax=Thermomonospora umbrina TaxID=111806 RepID=A0A3D9SS65_9ACTN|nr:hypothetical protein [Thermomonospora umbrina]REE95805.1 hypothetical protein DFJ69_1216 [Thermomonospora umbrina]
MRYGVARRGTAGFAALVLATGGCAMKDGNKSQVCADGKQAVQQYATRLKTVAANDPAQWKQVTDQLAVRFDALSKTAEDATLKKALKDGSTQFRAAATALGTGDAAALNKALAETPDRLGTACD